MVAKRSNNAFNTLGIGLPAGANSAEPVLSSFAVNDEFDSITLQEENIDTDQWIKNLTRDEKVHEKVLSYLVDRIDRSEKEMSNFHSRWNENERLTQAYVDLSAKEETLRNENKGGLQPNATKLILPYAYAVNSTITTYMMHTFTTRKPFFPVGWHKGESMDAARSMESVLQYQLEKTNYVLNSWKFFNDINIYGAGIYSINWDVIERMRTRREFRGTSGLGGMESRKELAIIYEGNRLQAQDPYMFFPDTRVPFSDLAEDGEFVFFLSTQSRLNLRGDSRYYQKAVSKINHRGYERRFNTSLRNRLRADGWNEGDDNREYHDTTQSKTSKEEVWVNQGVVKLIPSELGLSDNDEPQLWWFTIANKDRIIEAVPFDADHESLPVAVSEPFGFGYGIGQPGPVDLLSDIQYLVSWFVNSHIENVRTNLNNMWLVDPSKVVMKDLAKPGAGKLIRLKRTAYGADVRQALQQLPVQDVTRGHLADADLMLNIGQLLLGVNETLMGSPQQGGRKTATEMRVVSQAASGRLGMISRVISAHLANMRYQLTSNTLQYISDDFYHTITGKDGQMHNIRAADLDGDFTFPVSDGTLPLDRFALLEVYKEIFLGAVNNEILAANTDIIGLFAHIAELGGAHDIEKYLKPPAQPLIRPGQTQDVGFQDNEDVLRERERGNIVQLPARV